MADPWLGAEAMAYGRNPFDNFTGPQAGGSFGRNPFDNVASYQQGGNPFDNFGGAFDPVDPADVFFDIAVRTFGQTDPGGTTGTTTGGANGLSSPSGQDWAGVNQWDTAIQAAANQFGVPANLIKAIMKLESGGDPNSRSPQDAVGLMQIHLPTWGYGGAWAHDPVANVMKGAEILRDSYDRWVANGAANPWEEATKDYIGRGGADAFGTTASTYWDRVKGDWDTLNGFGGGTPGGGSFGSGTGDFHAVTNGQGHISFDFGAEGGANLYGYGLGHGTNGSEHTGIDVGVPYGTTLYAPMGGTVVCAGTNNGGGSHGFGCAAFSDDGGGVGRVEILLDNGASIILGHSSAALVGLGQRVEAGQAVARSGTAGTGAHVHLEARTYGNGTYTIVDPRTVLGGSGSFVAGGAPATGGYTPAPQPSGGNWWDQPLETIYGPY